jgi:hypothetical protein
MQLPTTLFFVIFIITGHIYICIIITSKHCGIFKIDYDGMMMTYFIPVTNMYMDGVDLLRDIKIESLKY